MWMAIRVSLRPLGARINVLTGRLRCLVLAALAPLAVTGCGGNADVSRASGQCSEQIVLSLAPGLLRTDKLIGDVSSDAKVRLEYLRSSSPTLFVYALSAKGKDPGCTNALARLRQDPRVRFAELDRRRTHFDAAR
jgi:hypothetical protein